MQFGMAVHTEDAQAEIRKRLAAAFARVVIAAREDVELVLAVTSSVSPVASGQMQSSVALFSDAPESDGLVDAHRFRFGLGRGLRSHEVRFEREGDSINVHTSVDEHVFEDEAGMQRWCSEELVGIEGLLANPNAAPRPLTRGMVEVWGQSMIPTNAKTFREGQVNVVEINPLLPRVEGSSLMAKLRTAVQLAVR